MVNDVRDKNSSLYFLHLLMTYKAHNEPTGSYNKLWREVGQILMFFFYLRTEL